ncbi:unnamed protein product [Prorocentrum cordatum]|uniref:Protein-serine/threonine kinase n=1 Tax=Prorocentrum cordatum TaxID=2364126 RepID=A0ABN9VAZ3_9DINO|nr:unnamed protein product [Polarella glacialis]
MLPRSLGMLPQLPGRWLRRLAGDTAVCDWSCTATARRLGAGRAIAISSDRLEAFMKAELDVFAARKDRPLQPLKLQDILRASSSLPLLAQLLHVELPVRFARRIKHLQRIPGWERIPELVALHDMHLESFRELRLASPEALEHFAQVVSQVRLRHRTITRLFAEALQRVDRSADAHLAESSLGAAAGPVEEGSEAQVQRRHLERWAETFLNSRVSTEIQMSHFVACIKAQSGPQGGADSRVGIVDTRLDLRDVCARAVAEVQGGPWECAVAVEHVGEDFHFSGAGRGPGAQGIGVTVCAGDRQAVLRVSDRGGGVPCDMVDRMLWFTGGSTAHVPSSPDGADDDAAQGSQDRPWGVFGGESPLAGRGMGLPLSRAYARYLSGSLQVVNLPNLGVDAFLSVDRIDFKGAGPAA